MKTCRKCGSFFERRYCDSCKRARELRSYAKLTVEKILWKGAKQRASRKNLPFDLDITDIVIPNYCPVLGLKIERFNRETAPSIDRIDNSKGYTKDNIYVISNRANRIKNDSSIEEMKMVIKYMEQN